jgi:hypothetical protein
MFRVEDTHLVMMMLGAVIGAILGALSMVFGKR